MTEEFDWPSDDFEIAAMRQEFFKIYHHTTSTMKSFITFLIKRKCLSLVTSFNLLFKTTAAITESTAGIGFPVFISSVEIFKAR